MSYRSIFILGDEAWPGLKFNPAKGDLEAIDDLASDVKAVSTELDELEELLTSIGKNSGVWRGEAAERFSKKLGKLPKYLNQGSDSMGRCAKTLHKWHSQLSQMQHNAQGLEAEAVTARREADRLTSAYNSENDRLRALGPMPADEADRLNQKLDRQRAEVEQAQDKLEKLIREAEDIYGRWNDRAQIAEAAIIEASENHPPDFGFWERVGDGLKEVARDAGDWLAENADLLSTISSALTTAALACQIIPGIGTAAGVALGAAAGAFALGAMAGHAVQGMRGQKMGWVKMGLDAFGVIPGASGLIGLARGGKAAGALALEKGIHSGFLQSKVIQPVELKIAGAFGKTMDEAAITTMNQYTQMTIKAGTAAFGGWKEATS
ncbi:putative T7SS-secreted protein [Streptomyces luteolus]|uniref:Putative T7SS secretion signal domain-containing protein n=1 Tax=Streptomyces luteolus TaxID=3043615 RepID=A0ABT6SR51_9ACTN|nr:hypothetical protein [Streptomyces sp. B-S-A12]MDI3418061.1 hypothetical protein [Streptomyces sp. B-S-A12]